MSIKDTIVRSLFTVAGAAKEKSPEILVTTGIGLVIFAGVKACQKTLELPEVIESHKETLKEIEENKSEDGLTVETTKGTIKVQDAVVQTQAHFALDIIKLYALPVGIGVMGIACIVGSHYILNKRCTKAIAAYVATSEAFKRYRDRVADRFGADVEREIRYNIKKVEDGEEEIIDEKGKKKKVKKYVEVVDPNEMLDDYTAFFCPFTTTEWNASMEMNRFKIAEVERWANQALRIKGKYYINNILEDLGIKGRPSGQYVGWIYDDKDPNHVGDNVITINIEPSKFRNPLTGHLEPGFILEFNADGNIINKAYK